MSTTTGRIIRCRYLDTHPRRGVNQCTGEAVDPDAELLLCTTHLASAWRMVDAIRLAQPVGGAR
ncbi:hypothetical protein [Micromonospora chalcea]|uniref:hypothetical protein n=1 Tax=Micromonospora chalcea TaxID=1874 RepID=UPI003D70241C